MSTTIGVSPSLAERAYAELRREIVTLVREPGDPLREDALMLELGLGRTPIREALRRLADERLVVVMPRSGTFVSEVDPAEALQIAEVRIEIEGFAAALAAERASAEERVEHSDLRRALALARDGDELLRLDERIHGAIYRASRNPFLQATAEGYFQLALRLWSLVLAREPALLAETTGEHDALIEAIVAGDVAAAQRRARAHVGNIRRAIAATLDG